MIPHSSFALHTLSTLQRTRTGVGREAFLPVAYERFAIVANCAYHCHTCGELPRMLYDAVSSFRHAFLLPALSTYWQLAYR